MPASTRPVTLFAPVVLITLFACSDPHVSFYTTEQRERVIRGIDSMKARGIETTEDTSAQVRAPESDLQRAFRLVDSIHYYIEQENLHGLSHDSANAHADPFIADYENLRLSLSPAEKDTVERYALRRLNGISDKQVKRRPSSTR